MTYQLCCADSYHTLHHHLGGVPEEKDPLLSHSGSFLHGHNTDKVCSYGHGLGHLDEKVCRCTMANSDHTEIDQKEKEMLLLRREYFFT